LRVKEEEKSTTKAVNIFELESSLNPYYGTLIVMLKYSPPYLDDRSASTKACYS
jgi:hypothetical protein